MSKHTRQVAPVLDLIRRDLKATEDRAAMPCNASLRIFSDLSCQLTVQLAAGDQDSMSFDHIHDFLYVEGPQRFATAPEHDPAAELARLLAKASTHAEEMRRKIQLIHGRVKTGIDEAQYEEGVLDALMWIVYNGHPPDDSTTPRCWLCGCSEYKSSDLCGPHCQPPQGTRGYHSYPICSSCYARQHQVNTPGAGTKETTL